MKRFATPLLIAALLGLSAGLAAQAPCFETLPNPLGNGLLMAPTAVFAAHNAPSIYADRHPVNKQLAAAAQAAEGGDFKAQLLAAGYYSGGTAGARNYAAAARLVKMALDNPNPAGDGHYRAEAAFGKLLLLGRGVPRDPDAAYPLLLDAANHAVPIASSEIGLMYLCGWHVAQDPANALAILEKAAVADPGANLGLGILYLEGWGVDADYQRALELFSSSASYDGGDGWVKLGEMAMYGIGGAVDYTRARACFQRAAALDNPLGLFGIAELASRGWGMPGGGKNFIMAFQDYKAAAGEGLPLAEGEYAAYNYLGLGRVPKNAAAAQEWGQRAAADGDRLALKWLMPKLTGAAPPAALPDDLALLIPVP